MLGHGSVVTRGDAEFIQQRRDLESMLHADAHPFAGVGVLSQMPLVVAMRFSAPWLPWQPEGCEADSSLLTRIMEYGRDLDWSGKKLVQAGSRFGVQRFHVFCYSPGYHQGI